VLKTWTRMIARYHIQQQRDKTNEDSGRIERDYRSASRALEAVAAGDRALGAGDPLLDGSSAGSPQVSAQDRIFTRDGLADF
jgi:phage gp36-like protein